ncbi:type 1 fimbrae adaptor subunit FimG [Klebsiella michiganensis]|nr:type 1 fimbrae adaptor subunit FimG [Klebsiella michiganensis]
MALTLSNCPVGTSRVTASFSGTADATGYYKNQGTAGNIQLELQDEGGTTLNTGARKEVQVDDATQSASFPATGQSADGQRRCDARNYSGGD